MIKEIKLHNLGTINKNEVVIETKHGKFSLYFSYLTLIGVSWWFDSVRGRAVIENYWSTTTGKLLNELEPDKKHRLKQPEFDKEVSRMFTFINR